MYGKYTPYEFGQGSDLIKCLDAGTNPDVYPVGTNSGCEAVPLCRACQSDPIWKVPLKKFSSFGSFDTISATMAQACTAARITRRIRPLSDTRKLRARYRHNRTTVFPRAWFFRRVAVARESRCLGGTARVLQLEGPRVLVLVLQASSIRALGRLSLKLIPPELRGAAITMMAAGLTVAKPILDCILQSVVRQCSTVGTEVESTSPRTGS